MTENELRFEAQDLNQQAKLLLNAKNFNGARAILDKAIEIDPMLVDSYRNYGDLYMLTKEYENAKNSYKKALLIEKNGLFYFLYGNACFMNDEMQLGLENYNMAINEGYDNEEMMFFMGMAYEHMNEDSLALRYYNKACIKNPARADYWVKKISALYRLGGYEKAEADIDNLLARFPELFESYHFKTQIMLVKHEFTEAIAFSKKAAEKFPEDVDLMFDYARALAFGGKYDEAIKEIARAKKMKYYSEAIREFTILEARIFAEKQNFASAIESCKACIAMSPVGVFDGEAYFMLMNLYIAENNYAEILNCAEAIINANSGDPYYYAALYYKPFALKQLGETERAEAEFTKANSIYRLATLKKPGALDIYLYRVMCLRDLGEYSKALELLDFVQGVNADIAEIYTVRASIYTEQGEETLAKRETEKACKLKPELKSIYIKGE